MLETAGWLVLLGLVVMVAVGMRIRARSERGRRNGSARGRAYARTPVRPGVPDVERYTGLDG